jgi:hypothetical protein
MSCIGTFLAVPFLLCGLLTIVTGTFYGTRASTGQRRVVRGGLARAIGILMTLPFLVGVTALVTDVLGPMLALSLMPSRMSLSDVIGAASTSLVLFEAGLAIVLVIAVSILYRLNREPDAGQREVL